MRNRVGQWLAGLLPANRPQARQRLTRAVSCAIEPLEQRQLMSVSIAFQGNASANSTGMTAQITTLANQLGQMFGENLNLKVDLERVSGMGTTPFVVTAEKFTFDYDTVRTAMVNDAAADESVVGLLPTYSEVSYDTSAGNQIAATRANLLALGFSANDLDSRASAYDPTVLDIDFTIKFNGALGWDANRNDGITSGWYDFTAYATQAIFQGLGFVSSIDAAGTNPTTLDLFRVAPGAAATDFTSATRILTAGTSSVFYDGGVFDPSTISMSGYGLGEIAMGTGVAGDGRQAGSWKDNAITGKYLGVMDSVHPTGTAVNTLSTDTRALGLIGWDITSTTPMLTPGGVLTINGTEGDDIITVPFSSGVYVTVNGVATPRYWQTGVSQIVINGLGGNDDISASQQIKNLVVYGGDGNDTITGGNANDSLYGEAGDDVIRGGTGKDLLSGGDGTDTVTFSEKTAGLTITFDGLANDGTYNEQDNVSSDFETLIGSAYNDNLNASSKSSGISIYGGAGNDTIRGSLFSDVLYGEDGNDTLYANDGTYDFVDGGNGIDTAYVDLLVDSWNLLDILL